MTNRQIGFPSFPSFSSFKGDLKQESNGDEEKRQDLSRYLSDGSDLSPSPPPEGDIQYSFAGKSSRKTASQGAKRQKRKHQDNADHKRVKKRMKGSKLDYDNFEYEPTTPWTNHAGLFTVDTRGDLKNLQFQSLHISDIPKYRILGDRVIGLPEHVRINFRQSRSTSYVRLDIREYAIERPVGRYAAFKAALRERPKRLLTNENQSFPTDDDFVMLLPEDSKPRSNANAVSGTSFRSLLESAMDQIRKAKLGVVELEEEGLFEVSAKDAFISKNQELNRALQKDRKNVLIWLELVSHQDSLQPDGKKVSLQALSEKKIAIFEQALKELPGNEVLISEMMRCCELYMETATYLNTWDGILKSSPSSVKLWMQYLDFMGSSFVIFNVFSAVETYERCLNSFKGLNPKSLIERGKIEADMILVVMKLCRLLDESGYNERAVAILQALVEFNCHSPSDLNGDSYEERLDVFEEWWDSEVPRIGEEGCAGWNKKLKIETRKFKVNNDDKTSSISQDWGLFVETEKVLEEKHWLPGRLDEEEDGEVTNEDDAFRLVVFEDDVRSSMFDLSLPQSKVSLYYAFLRFLGIQTNPSWSSNDLLLSDASYLGTGLVEKMLEMAKLNNTNRHEFPLKGFPRSMDTMFSRKWFDLYEDYGDDKRNGRNEFLSNLLASGCVFEGYDPQIRVERLLIESQLYGVKSAKKMAKSMLKTVRNDVILWNTYAQLCYKTDDVEEARAVYKMALQACSEKERIVLWRAMVVSELVTDENYALATLVAISTHSPGEPFAVAEPVAPTQVLRARRVLHGQFSHLLSAVNASDVGGNEITSHYMLLVALFEYLSNGVTEAIKIFDMFRDKIVSFGRTVLLEQMYMSQIKLLYNHFVANPAQSQYLRQTLEDCVSAFPNNTMGLLLYIWISSQNKFDFYTRGQEKLKALCGAQCLTRAFPATKQLNTNATRGLLKTLVESEAGRRSLHVWYYYVLFEQEFGSVLERKSVMVRAVHACPGAKVLYLTAMRDFQDCFSAKEIRDSLFETMVDKGVRIRGPSID